MNSSDVDGVEETAAILAEKISSRFAEFMDYKRPILADSTRSVTHPNSGAHSSAEFAETRELCELCHQATMHGLMQIKFCVSTTVKNK